MKTLNAITLAILMAASTAAMAGDEASGRIHIKGYVSEPTCTVSADDAVIELETISASELAQVPVGQAIEKGKKQTQLHLQCDAPVSAEHIQLSMSGNAAATGGTNVLQSNEDSGVGFAVLINNSTQLDINDRFDTNLFQGAENLSSQSNVNAPLTIEYVRTGEEITGGEVNSDVTFTAVYR